MEKLVRRGYEFHEEDLERTIEENLYDVAGIRVVCAFQEDIYHLSDLLIEQDDIRLIRTKDYIKNPEAERLPQSASDSGGSGIFKRGKDLCEGRGTVPHHCDGFLGKCGS